MLAKTESTRDRQTNRLSSPDTTCASCLCRGEKALGRVPGITVASVSFARQRIGLSKGPSFRPEAAGRLSSSLLAAGAMVLSGMVAVLTALWPERFHPVLDKGDHA